MVDEAILELYYTGRDNGNTLTLGAHRVLAEWIDGEVTHFQRKAGSNWVVAGMGSGSDYTASPEATLPLGSVASGWVQLDVTAAVQAWIADHANNYGLVLRQEAASGWVTYQFCSELGWAPCTPGQAPRLVIRYHLEAPAPVKAAFQQGVGGYAGANATCLSSSSSNNGCTWTTRDENRYFQVRPIAVPQKPSRVPGGLCFEEIDIQTRTPECP